MSCGARYQSAADLEPLAAARRTHQTPHVAAYQSHNAVLYVGATWPATSSLAGSGLTPRPPADPAPDPPPRRSRGRGARARERSEPRDLCGRRASSVGARAHGRRPGDVSTVLLRHDCESELAGPLAGSRPASWYRARSQRSSAVLAHRVDARRPENDRPTWRCAPSLGEHQPRRRRGSHVLRTRSTTLGRPTPGPSREWWKSSLGSVSSRTPAPTTASPGEGALSAAAAPRSLLVLSGDNDARLFRIANGDPGEAAAPSALSELLPTARELARRGQETRAGRRRRRRAWASPRRAHWSALWLAQGVAPGR
jgi:hypothetical protein